MVLFRGLVLGIDSSPPGSIPVVPLGVPPPRTCHGVFEFFSLSAASLVLAVCNAAWCLHPDPVTVPRFTSSPSGASLDAISIGGEQIFRGHGVGPLLPGTSHVPPPDDCETGRRFVQPTTENRSELRVPVQHLFDRQKLDSPSITGSLCFAFYVHTSLQWALSSAAPVVVKVRWCHR